MLYSESRRGTRRDVNGQYVPLDQQNTALWDAEMIVEADKLLRLAGTFDHLGPFQCQAAIQSVHADRRRSGVTDWTVLAKLYDALVLMKPTVGARVSHAAVTGRVQGPAAGLRHLNQMAERDINSYQPYWAVRAHLLAEVEDTKEAVAAYQMAIGLSESNVIRDWLQKKLIAL